jgi:beta-aspartyl-peptidase (threonine type)
MENRGDSGGVIVVIGLALVLLLLVGGGAGVYYVVSRQQQGLAMQAERALAEEAIARLEAERARVEAQAAAAAGTTSKDKEPVTDQNDSTRSAVESILRAQEDAWNRGDIDTFMKHYWKDDALTFSSEGKTTRGWTATLTRYRERYPTPEKMGRLQLSGLEITPLDDSAAMVLGQWKVEREGEPLSGNFSLVVRKFDDRWLIIHDHTSRIRD